MTNTNSIIQASYNAEAPAIIFTVADLSEYLDIGKNKAYDMLRKNIIPGGFRLGNTWRISKLAVDQYILKASGII